MLKVQLDDVNWNYDKIVNKVLIINLKLHIYQAQKNCNFNFIL